MRAVVPVQTDPPMNPHVVVLGPARANTDIFNERACMRTAQPTNPHVVTVAHGTDSVGEEFEPEVLYMRVRGA